MPASDPRPHASVAVCTRVGNSQNILESRTVWLDHCVCCFASHLSKPGCQLSVLCGQQNPKTSCQ